MSDLDRVRGRKLAPIPLHFYLLSWLPRSLGGKSVARQVTDAQFFSDPRDTLEWLYVQLIRHSIRPNGEIAMRELEDCIKEQEYRLRLLSSEKSGRFRPGIYSLLQRSYAEMGR